MRRNIFLQISVGLQPWLHDPAGFFLAILFYIRKQLIERAALPGKLKLAAAPIYGEGTVAKSACDLFHEQIAMRVFQYGSPLCKRGYLLNQARQGIGRAAHKADN